MNRSSALFYVTNKLLKLRGAAMLLFLQLMCVLASAQFSITKTFKDNDLTGLTIGGNSYLTAGVADPSGDGWLRLTNDANNQVGYVLVNQSFPSTLGVFIDFEYTAWRNTTAAGADGFSIFLYDATTSPFSIGGFGGSLGYAPKPPSTGLSGGYLGLGIDEYGNYSNPTEGRTGGPGFVPQAVALRGPAPNYAYISGTSSLTGSNKIDYQTATSTRPSAAQFYRRVQIYITKNNSTQQYSISVQWKTSVNGNFTPLFGPVSISNPPPLLKVGLAGSTGGNINKHEIRNLIITTPGNLRAYKTVDQSNAKVGDILTYKATAYNDTDGDLTGVSFNDDIPTNGFQQQSVSFSNDGFTGNTTSNTSSVSNVSLTMKAHSTITYTVTGKVTAYPTATNGIITNTAQIGVGTSGITDDDPSNDSYSVQTAIYNADLNITKSHTGGNCIDKTNGTPYIIHVTNTGPTSTAGQVLVQDAIPAGLSVVGTPVAPGWTISNSGNNYQFSRYDNLAANSSFPDIQLTLKPSAGNTSASFSNTATVSNSYDINTANNSATDIIYQTITANSGPDQTLCNAAANGFTMSANGGTAGTANWSIVTGSPTIASTTNASTTVTVPVGTSATLRWTITNNTCVSTSDVVLTNLALPSAAETGPDQILCNQVNSLLTATAPSAGVGSWQQISGPNTSVISTPNSASTAIQNLVPGVYIYRWSVTNGSCAANTKDVKVTVNPAINAGRTDLTQTLCGPSADVPLINETIAPSGGNGTFTYQWQSATDNLNYTNIAGATGATYDPPVISQTTYFRRSVSSDACPSAFSPVSLVTLTPPPTIANAGADQTSYNATTFSISGNIPVIGTGKWSVVSGNVVLANPDNYITTATILPNTTATLRWTITGASQCPVSFADTKITNVTQADLAITNAANNSFYTPGTNVIYTIIATNNGPSDVNDAIINDALPRGITSARWTEVSSNGSQTVKKSGSGVLHDSIKLVVGSSITYTITYDVPSNFTGPLNTTATINSSTIPDPVLANNTASVSLTESPQYSLTVTKTGQPVATAGQSIIYHVTIFNNGPSDLATARIQDTISSKIKNVTWSVTTTGDATTDASTGSGNQINLNGFFPAGSEHSAVINISGTVDAAATGSIENYASVIADNTVTKSSTVVTDILQQTGIQIIKTAPPSIILGDNIEYTITVRNEGPSDAPSIRITDTIPSSIENVTWVVQTNGVSSVDVSHGTGNIISVNASIPASASNDITILVDGVVGAAAQNQIINHATATSSGQNPVTATAITDVLVVPKFTINKTGPASVNAGENITYTIEVKNQGLSPADNVIITDLIPSQISNVTWTSSVKGTAVVNSGQSGTGNNISLNAFLPPDLESTVLIQVYGTVVPDVAGAISNSAQLNYLELPPLISNVINTTIFNKPGIVINKSGPASVISGSLMNYAMSVRNTGPSDAKKIIITDTIPPEIQNPTWITDIAGSASIVSGATGAGNIITIVANIPEGPDNRVQVSVTGTSNPSIEKTITNTATVIVPDYDSVFSNTVNTSLKKLANITIDKTGPQTIAAGTTINYTLQITNLGPSDADSVFVIDSVPLHIGNVKWHITIDSSIQILGNNAGDSNNVKANLTIPAGRTAYIIISGTIDPAYTGTLANHATASIGNQTVVSPVINTNVVNMANLRVNKSGPANLFAGQEIEYSIVVDNNGPSDAFNANFIDTVSSDIQNVTWSVSAFGGATISSGTTGSGNLVTVTGNIPQSPGNYFVVDIKGRVNPSFAGTIINKAGANVNGQPFVYDQISTLVTKSVGLLISKNGNQFLHAGENIAYSVMLKNNGPSDAANVSLRDRVSDEIENVSWSLTAYGSATINGSNTGTGNNINTSVNIPEGDSNYVMLNINGIVSPASAAGTIRNTATARPEATVSNNQAVSSTVVTRIGTEADVKIVKSGPSDISVDQVVHYTIAVTNAGPSDANNVLIFDTVPFALSNVTYQVRTTGSATVTATTPPGVPILVVGNISSTPGDTIYVDVTGIATLSGTAINTAHVVLPTGLSSPGPLEDRSSSITTGINTDVGINISKSGPQKGTIGSPVDYTIVVSNTGATSASNVLIKDIVPAEISNVSWTVTASDPNTSFTANTSQNQNDIDVTATIAGTSQGAGGAITIHVSGIITDNAGQRITNTATATFGAEVHSSSTITTITSSRLKIAKTGPSAIFSGQPVTYTIYAYNLGPAATNDARLSDLVPSEIKNVHWSAIANGNGQINGQTNGNGNNINLSLNLPAGYDNRVVVTITGIADPAYAGVIKNVSSITTSPTAPVASTSTDSIQTIATSRTDILITKSGPLSAYAGEVSTYIIKVENNGPSDASAINIIDSFDNRLANITWSATAKGNATITGGGRTDATGPVNLFAAIPAADSNYIEIKVTGLIKTSATGSITNTAMAISNGTTKTSTINTAILTLSNLSVKKAGPITARAGEQIIYSVLINNHGPSDAVGVNIIDTFDNRLTNVTWSATAVGNASINSGNRTNVKGNLNIRATIPADSTSNVLIFVTGIIQSDADGNIKNVAKAILANGQPFADSVITTLTSKTVLNITKTGALNAAPGTDIGYLLKLSNNGPSYAKNVVIRDTVPAQLQNVSWSATVTNAGRIVSGATGTGNAVEVTADLAPGLDNTINVRIKGTVAADFVGAINNISSASTLQDSVQSNIVTTQIDRQTSIRITKTGMDTANAGGGIHYVLVIDNSGPSTAENVSITDHLPAGINSITWKAIAYGTAKITGPQTGTGNVIATTADIPGESANYVRVLIDGTVAGNIKQLMNVASVTEPGHPVLYSDTVTTSVKQVTNLSVSKQGPAYVFEGDSILYRVFVRNLGPSDADGAVIREMLPPELANVDISLENGNIQFTRNSPQDANPMEIVIKKFPVNTIAVLNVRGIVKKGSPVIVNNVSLTVPPEVAELVPDNTKASVVTVVQSRSPLKLEKKLLDQSPYYPGKTVTYLLTVTNEGSYNVSPASLIDSLPAKTLLNNINGITVTTGSAVYDSLRNIIKWTLDLVQPGASFTLTYSATIASAGDIRNAAIVAGPVATSLPDTAAVTINAEAMANLSIRKEMLTAAPYDINDTVKYRIIAHNNGPNKASGVVVKDTLPGALSNPLSMIATSGTTSVSGGIITWSIDSMTVGANDTLIFTSKILQRDTIVNIASISSNELDTAGGNNTDTSAIAILSRKIQLNVEKKLIEGGPYYPGKTVTYEVTITNNGDKNVTPVFVTDSLPAQTVLSNINTITVTAGVAVYNSTGNAIDWNLTTLAPGVTLKMTYKGVIAGSGDIKNTVIVSGPREISEPDTAFVIFNASPLADLSIKKEVVTPPPYRINDKIQYKITVNNLGPNDASGVVVNDAILATLSQPSNFAPTLGSVLFLNNALNWNIGNLASGANETMTFTAKILQGPTVVNTARVSANERDTVPDNNVSSVQIQTSGDGLFIPNMITPNGDGKNDKFIILGVAPTQTLSIQIFNRWGNKVFESKAYQNDWDGSNLLAGTYYYIIKLNTGQNIKEYKGWIQLMR